MKPRRQNFSKMIYDILIDWFYLGMTAFAIMICLYVIHLIVFDLDLIGLITWGASLIEAHFWTSIFCLCFLAVVTYDRLEKQRRARGHHYDHSYEWSQNRQQYTGDSLTSQLKRRNTSAVSRTLNTISKVGEALGLVLS